MGKVEIGNFCCLTADIWNFFLQKCFLSSPLRFIWILSKLLNLFGCHGNIKGQFLKKYSKIFSSEAVRGMKLKLCIHVHDISLYINMFYIVIAHVLSLLWQLKSFHRLIIGKVEIGIYFCVTADVLKKVLQNCFWSCPLPTIWILSKLLILIGCYGNRKAKFLKKNIEKSSSQNNRSR